MSLDFSMGDFLAGASLIKEIISALRGTAELEYRELELELHGLQRALDGLEHLQPGPGQEVAVNSVKVAALMCRYPLEDFQAKLKRYQLLSNREHYKKRDVVDGCIRKVQWNLSMPDEVQKIRAYIAAHVGSLNMRLLTVGLTTMTVAQTEASARDGLIRHELTGQMRILTENTAKVGTLYTLVTVRSYLNYKVWSALLRRIQNNQTQIDIRHTWFQEPLRLDDAFGRTIPIPVEYGWSKLEAIIHDQFCNGPGNEKVFAGEYEIFKTEDSSLLITQQNFSLLRPGIPITMAMVIGRYGGRIKDQCPKPDCKSKIFTNSNAGGLKCVECDVWFGKSRTTLPRPFRLLSIEELEVKRFGKVGNSKKGQRSTDIARRDIFKEIREERKWYKNLRIHPTDLSSATRILDEQEGVEIQLLRGKHAMATTRLRPNQETGEAQTPTNCMSDIVRKIVIEEAGLQEGDLEDCIDFGSVCIDSLMSLNTLGRLRENLQVDLDPVVFAQYPNVKELSKFIERFHSGKGKPQKSSLPMTEMELRLREIWAQVFGITPEEIGKDDSFTEMGADSLIAVELVLVARQ